MALAIDTNHMLQHCIPYNEPLRMGRSRGRYELYKIHAYATTSATTSIHHTSTTSSFELMTPTPATQAALDWQADQDDELDDLEVFNHLKQMAATYSFPKPTQIDGAIAASTTTLVASVQSPIFNLRAQGRPPSSFHRYSLRMIVFEYNYYVCNIFGYDFNGMDESGIGETDMHEVLPCDGDVRRSCYNLLPWFLSPRIVWAATAENPAVLWHMQLDFVDLLTPRGQSSQSLGKRRRALNPFLQVSQAGGDDDISRRGRVPEAKRFKGVRYRGDRRTWVAEMRPPKSKNKVSFGDFKCQSQAARAVDAAFHYFNKKDHLNFADTSEILSMRPNPSGLDEEDKLKFVKEQAKWLASFASTLPPTSTPAIARAAGALVSVEPFEIIPESSRGYNTAVTFRFRSFSEISSPSGSDTDKADDGVSQPQPINLTAADHVGVVNEVEEEQGMFQWIMQNALVDPCSQAARRYTGSVHITEKWDCPESCNRPLPNFLNSPGSEQSCDEKQRMMSPGLDFLSMSPPAPLFQVVIESE